MGICAAQSLFGQGPQAQPTQGAGQAQPAGPKNGPSSIAVVDVGHILNNHPTMKPNLKTLEAEMKTAQEEIETRRKALLSETEMVQKNYDTNTAEFKQKQEQLISQESKLRVDFMGKEKEFAERQANVIYQSYQSINEAIKKVAEYYKYDLVVRYSREQNEMNPKDPKTVNFGIQRDVLFFNPQVNLTEIVLNVLNNSVPATAVQPQPSPVTTTPNGPGVRSANGGQNIAPGRQNR
jgi:Skp family chaperone for outer membrane proteins